MGHFVFPSSPLISTHTVCKRDKRFCIFHSGDSGAPQTLHIHSRPVNQPGFQVALGNADRIIPQTRQRQLIHYKFSKTSSFNFLFYIFTLVATETEMIQHLMNLIVQASRSLMHFHMQHRGNFCIDFKAKVNFHLDPTLFLLTVLSHY